MTTNILTLCGSARAASFNAALLRALPVLAPGALTFSSGPSVADVPPFDADLLQASGPPAAIALLGKDIRDAHGLVIASPEYNYSVPGTLKNVIDWISRLPNQPLRDKPVLLQSVSMGVLGGARMQYHLRQILVSLDARVFNRPEVMIGNAATRFDEAGHLSDQPTRDLVAAQLAAFATFITSWP